MNELDVDHAATAANQAVGACGRRSGNQYESLGLASQTLVGVQGAVVRIHPMAIYGEEGHSTLRQGATEADLLRTLHAVMFLYRCIILSKIFQP
jgi:hypothetical protein